MSGSHSQRLANLERSLLRIDPSKNANIPDIALETQSSMNILAWKDALKMRCLVILGEAGAGKTSELRLQRDHLVAQGRRAFYLPIEELAQRGVEGAVEMSQLASFRAWRDSEEGDVWFLLDSVDEAALKGFTLSTALKRLALEQESRLGSIHVAVTCRVSDWRQADLDAITDFSGCLSASISSADGEWNGVCVVQLGSLREDQVVALTRHYDIADAQDFLRAVREANAWSFLQRPMDVRWVAGYWMSHKRFGSLSELIDYNVQERLKERGRRPTRISTEKAREGARALALAVCLTQVQVLRIEDDVEWDTGSVIDPSTILPGWKKEEVDDLLTRGIFDEATYGRVRFHHRSVQEFLAAEELLAMIENGLPLDDLDVLLFKERSGRVVIPRHLVALAAWCAPSVPEIRKRMLAIAPQHLIDEGDPSQLSADDRRDVLRAYTDRFGDRKQVYFRFDSFGMQRFSCSALAHTLIELLEHTNQAEHVQSVLLDIVEEGRLEEAYEAVVKVAVAPGTTSSIRYLAVRIIALLGTSDQRKKLTALLDGTSAISSHVTAELLRALYPEFLTEEQAVQLMLSSNRTSRSDLGGLSTFLATELPSRCDSQRRRAMLDALVSRVFVQPRDAATKPKAIPEHVWTAKLACVLVADILQDKLPRPNSFSMALDLIYDTIEQHNMWMYRGEKVLKEDELVRQALFWHRVEQSALKQKRYPRHLGAVGATFGVLGFSQADSSWLVKDALLRIEVRERLLAFSCVVALTPRDELTNQPQWDTLDELARTSDEAHSSSALGTRLSRIRLEWDIPRQRYPFERDNIVRKRQKKRSEKQVLENLMRNVEAIRAGSDLHALMFLYESCRVDASDSLNRDFVTFESVAKKFGSEIAAAAVDGYKAFWRANEPTQLHVFEPVNQTPWHDTIALAGIALEVHEGLGIVDLPQELLRKAIGYSVWKLNGFPEWLTGSVERCPKLMSDVLNPIVRRDFAESMKRTTTDETGHGRIIGKVAYAAQSIRATCARTVFECLANGEDYSLGTLRHAIKIVSGTADLEEELLYLARQRCEAQHHDASRFALWWCTWVELEPRDAVQYLAKVASMSEHADVLIETVCATVWGRHEERKNPKATRRLREDATALAGLIPVVYGHVRAGDDVEHEGGYSPGRRDDAQDFRNSLLNWLAGCSGSEAIQALDKFSNEPLFHAQRDWIRHLSDERVVLDSSQPLSIADALSLIDACVVQPRNDQEFFQLAKNQLKNIRHEVQDGDFSIRSLFSPKNDAIEETPVQNFLAGELERNRRNRYSVVREPEVTRRKKPDIRLLNDHCLGPVTIEIKIAERWSLHQLEDGIRDQLVGTYMKANKSDYGIFVVCSSGPAHQWKGNGNAKLDFAGVLRHLEEYASSLVGADSKIHGLHVIGVDFH